MFTTFGLVEGLAMSPEVGDNREILAYFCLCCKPFYFQPAYAASLCSCSGKWLYEPMSLLESDYSCKPEARSPISPLYFVVIFALHFGAFVLLLRSLVGFYRYYLFYKSQ